MHADPEYLRQLFELLESNNILYQRVDHRPVYTCEEARQFVPPIEGAETKNLFLRDEKGRRHFLVSIPAEKSVDLKPLGLVLGVKGLSFASAERLKKCLGIEPGSVTLLAVVNDAESSVEVVVDADLWREERILCHPLVNTSTMSLRREDLERFLGIVNHPPRVVSVPGVRAFVG